MASLSSPDSSLAVISNSLLLTAEEKQNKENVTERGMKFASPLAISNINYYQGNVNSEQTIFR